MVRRVASFEAEPLRRNRGFESRSLHRGVCKLSVPLALSRSRCSGVGPILTSSTWLSKLCGGVCQQRAADRAPLFRAQHRIGLFLFRLADGDSVPWPFPVASGRD